MDTLISFSIWFHESSKFLYFPSLQVTAPLNQNFPPNWQKQQKHVVVLKQLEHNNKNNFFKRARSPLLWVTFHVLCHNNARTFFHLHWTLWSLMWSNFIWQVQNTFWLKNTKKMFSRKKVGFFWLCFKMSVSLIYFRNGLEY